MQKWMNTIKSNISEACKVQVDCLEDSESDSYDKNYMKEKANEYLAWTAYENKKVREISAKPAPKKGKIITSKNFIW